MNKYGIRMTGKSIKRCRNTKMMMIFFLLFNFSASKAELNWNKDETRLGKALKNPIWRTVAFKKSAYGVI